MSANDKVKTPNVEKLQEKHKRQIDKLLGEVGKISNLSGELAEAIDAGQDQDDAGKPVRALKKIRSLNERIAKVCNRVQC